MKTEFLAACDRLAADLHCAGTPDPAARRVAAAYARALNDAGDTAWRAFYCDLFAVLEHVVPEGHAACAAFRRLAALTEDDLGIQLLSPEAGERVRARLVEAA